MEWFDDFIFVIASEYKSTVFVECLNVRSKKELYIGSGIVCFVDDNDFVVCRSSKRYRGGKVLRLITYRIKKPTLVRTVDNIIVTS